jgi:hypothetical protein
LLCGVKNGYIKNYIDRGKIIIREDGYIDDENPFNADFLRKRLDKMASEKVEIAKIEHKKANKPPKIATETPINNARNLDIAPQKPIKKFKKVM